MVKKITQHLLIRLVRIVSLVWNPIVSRKIAGKELLMPLTHELPFYMKLFPIYSQNLVRLVDAVQQKYPSLKVIDVGANIGDTVAFIRTKSNAQILCIEGDDFYFQILEKNTIKDEGVIRKKVYLGEKEETVKAVLDSARGTGELKESDQQMHIVTLDSVLNGNPDNADVKVVKIDTDGFDNAIIRGATQLLEKAHPIIFFEYVPDLLKKREQPEAIFDYLFKRGYSRGLFYDNYGSLIIGLQLNDREALSTLTNYFLGHGVAKYLDVAVFHENDSDIYQRFMENELKFFSEQSRSQ